jgi:aminopeptidase N
MFVRTLAISMAVLLAAVPVGADTYPRQPGIDAIHYVFRLTIEDASNRIAGETTMTFRMIAAVPELWLDLASATADGKGMTVTAVTVDGNAASFRHADNRLRIPLPSTAKPGVELLAVVTYNGVPANGLRLIPNIHGERTMFSENWPNRAREWLPMIDHPYDKATGEFLVTAPAHYQVVANGRLVEEVDAAPGVRRTHWKQSVPISSWLYALGVARFSVHHYDVVSGIPQEVWVFPQDREKGYEIFELRGRQAFEFFSEWVGPYSYEKLAHVQANGVGGGMELASSIFYGYGAAGAGRQLIAHEMAHQWFGDSATEADWDDVWLSEGFATYFALLYTEFADGRDAFLEGVRRSKATALNYALANPESTIVHRNLADISRVIANNAQIYQGGAQVLHNIRGVVGTPVFWAGIRSYYARHKDGTATTDDFRRAMEEACRSVGDRCPADGKDLAWLFSQLLNRGGALQVQGTWRYDATSKQVEITLEQTQPTGLFRMPIEIRVTTAGVAPAGAAGGPAAARVPPLGQLTQQRQTFSFPASSEPTEVELDPEAWVMMRASLVRK